MVRGKGRLEGGACEPGLAWAAALTWPLVVGP
jgi:hypothetical protein